MVGSPCQSVRMEFNTDSEQRFHDLEQRHVLLQREHEAVVVDKEALKGEPWRFI